MGVNRIFREPGEMRKTKTKKKQKRLKEFDSISCKSGNGVNVFTEAGVSVLRVGVS